MLADEQLSRWLQEISRFRRVVLDTNAVIYHLQQAEPYASLLEHLVRFMERGALAVLVSTIVEVEVLVGPLRANDQRALTQATLFFWETPHLRVSSCNSEVARRAAMVLAQTGLRLPDAIIVATALEDRCDAIIGNDIQVASRFSEIPYLLLENYLT
jgi:predicted nucleic acid-binding protein